MCVCVCDNILNCVCPCSTAVVTAKCIHVLTCRRQNPPKSPKSFPHAFHVPPCNNIYRIAGCWRRLGEFTLLGLGFALHRRSGFIEGLLGCIRRLVRLPGLWRSPTSRLETSS